jgi:hypothetical protein
MDEVDRNKQNRTLHFEVETIFSKSHHSIRLIGCSSSFRKVKVRRSRTRSLCAILCY